jgi:hypothetical protein
MKPAGRRTRFTLNFYREAVAAQSPGLLQPWVMQSLFINPERVAALGHNRVAVEFGIKLTQG